MFESVTPDPGADALKRAARIFYVIAALSVIASVFFVIAGVMGRGLQLAIYLLFGAIAYITGKGIEDQRRWAKWLGIALGVLELLNFPIGTVIGIAILVYLNRAIKAKLFVAGPTTAA